MKNIAENALYLVPTPIGNMDDITKRAFHILSSSDIIACEDTRNSGVLLKNLRIVPRKLMSYHEHNEEQRSEELLNFLLEGKSVSVITDAGYPGISDPGNILVKKCIDKNIKIIPLPGATAIIPALTASGLIENDFLFAGFPPNKKGRKAFFEKYISTGFTTVFYESPHRIIKSLNEIAEITGLERKICIAREISKIHEEFIRGTISEVLQNLESRSSVKGEIVVILEGIK